MAHNGHRGLSLATLDELKRELELWRERGKSLRILIGEFLSNEQHFRYSLTGSYNDVHINLLPKSVRAMVLQVSAHVESILPFFGPNSSGKSMLLNVLLGGDYMPSGPGHVTGRICVISFSEMADANIALTTLLDFHTGNTPSSNKISITGWNTKDVSTELRRLLGRQEEFPNGQSYADWVKVVVHIQFPFELLRSGMVFVDLPGTSKADDMAVQMHMRDFFSTARPAGVCFTYSNPSFSDDAKSAYDFLVSALDDTKDAHIDPEIFFISTKLEFEALSNDNGWNIDVIPDPGWSKEIFQSRWNLLKRAIGRSCSSYEDDLNFSVANARDYRDRSILANTAIFDPIPELVEVFEEFRRRLFTFSVLVQRVRYETIYKRLLDGSAHFFRIYNAHKSKNLPMVKIMAKEAEEATKLMEEKLIEASNAAIDELQKILTDLWKMNTTWDKIWSKANIASLSFDGKNQDSEGENCINTIRDAIGPTVKDLVITPAMDELERLLKSSLEEVIQARIQTMNRNVIFGAAVRGAIIVDSIQFHSAGAVGNLLHRFIRSLQNVSHGTVVLSILASPILMSIAAATAVAAIFGWIKAKLSNINGIWRTESTKALLEDMVTRISVNELKKNAKADVIRLTNEVKKNIDHELQTTEHSLMCLEKSQSKLKELRASFASYECACWVELRRLEGNLAPVVYESSITDSGRPTPMFKEKSERCRLMYAQWKGKRVLIKKAADPNAYGDVLLSFLEDAHYSLYIRRLSAEAFLPVSILPALAIHREDFPNNYVEYSLIYDDCEGEVEELFLNDKKAHPNNSRITVFDRLYFCLQAAMGVSSLHQCDMIHRNVRPSSLWYRKEAETGHYVAYLTDFASATTNSANYSTVTGDLSIDWVPPEIVRLQRAKHVASSSTPTSSPLSTATGASVTSSVKGTPPTRSSAEDRRPAQMSYDRRCDIWMLGKTIDWIMTDKGVEYKKIPDWELILRTMADNPEDRPTADEVVDKLKDMVVERVKLLSYKDLAEDSPLRGLLSWSKPSKENVRRLQSKVSFYNADPVANRLIVSSSSVSSIAAPSSSSPSISSPSSSNQSSSSSSTTILPSVANKGMPSLPHAPSFRDPFV
jgi:serine/threonine protein kinase